MAYVFADDAMDTRSRFTRSIDDAKSARSLATTKLTGSSQLAPFLARKFGEYGGGEDSVRRIYESKQKERTRKHQIYDPFATTQRCDYYTKPFVSTIPKRPTHVSSLIVPGRKQCTQIFMTSNESAADVMYERGDLSDLKHWQSHSDFAGDKTKDHYAEPGNVNTVAGQHRIHAHRLLASNHARRASPGSPTRRRDREHGRRDKHSKSRSKSKNRTRRAQSAGATRHRSDRERAVRHTHDEDTRRLETPHSPTLTTGTQTAGLPLTRRPKSAHWYPGCTNTPTHMVLDYKAVNRRQKLPNRPQSASPAVVAQARNKTLEAKKWGHVCPKTLEGTIGTASYTPVRAPFNADIKRLNPSHRLAYYED